ncbi:MAG: hypothetical protein AB7H88_14380 [Vicinamibacterales bacterium]
MTTASRHPARDTERGMALVATLLLLLVVSGLVAGLTMSGNVEVAMGRNEVQYAGARAAAEAGLNRAIEIMLANAGSANLLAGQDGLVNTADPADAVNADNGRLDYLMTGSSPWPVGSSTQYSYDVQILDDDDPSLYSAALTAADLTAMGEDGVALTDTNSRLLLRSTGWGPDGTRVQLDTMLIPQSMPAILVNGSLSITGNPTVDGAQGSVHANQDLSITGNSTDISGNATSTGTYTAKVGWSPDGYAGGGYPAIPVPAVAASDYLGIADFVLSAGATITDTSTGTVVCDASSDGNACKATYGWEFQSGAWRIGGNSAATGTFYVETDVTIAGSPGSASSPLSMSIISEGSIDISGNPNLTPENAEGILFVTDGDLEMGGNLTQPLIVEGRILVHEQLSISGNPTLAGQIIVEDSPTVATLVTSNTISGNPSVTYNGTLTALSYTVSGWREPQ